MDRELVPMKVSPVDAAVLEARGNGAQWLVSLQVWSRPQPECSRKILRISLRVFGLVAINGWERIYMIDQSEMDDFKTAVSEAGFAIDDFEATETRNEHEPSFGDLIQNRAE